MHDPMCVAHEIFLPIPRRALFEENTDTRRRERGDHVPRWRLGRRQYTNPDHLGEPIYPWWRPKGYSPRIAGRAYRLTRLATIWHVEPNGADAGKVCKHWRDGKPDRRWRWHVRHWKVQIHPVQRLAHRFSRCGECGRRMNRASRHGYMGGDSVCHRECMDRRQLRGERKDADAFIEHLFHAYRLTADLDVEEAVEALLPKGFSNDLWREHYRLRGRLGWEHNSKGEFVRAER